MSNEIIVKVGKKSQLKFSHSKVYRAITANDLVKLTNAHKDCSIIIIEGIDKDDEKDVKDFITNFKKENENKQIYFYIPDNDDITSGVADELDYNIYLSLNDLYSIIYETFNINVSIFLDDKKKLNSAEMQESLPEGITDIFGNFDSKDDDEIKRFIEEADNIEEISKEEQDNLEEIEDEPEINKEEIQNIFDNALNKEIEELKRDSKSIKSDDTTDDATSDNVSVQENNESEVNTTLTNSVVNSKEYEELQIKYRDLQYDYSVILKDMKTANADIDELNDLIMALKDEKEAMIKRYDELMASNEVIEDPISLEEYQSYKEQIKTLENEVQEYKATIEKLNNNLQDTKNTIEEKELTIVELEAGRKELKNNLDELKDKIESGEIHKDVIEQYTEQVQELTTKNNQLQETIGKLNSEIESLHDKIDDLTSTIEIESTIRIETIKNITQAFNSIPDLNDKLLIVEEKNKQLSTKLEEAEKSNKINVNKINEQSEKIKKLESEAFDISKRMELSASYADSERIKLQSQIDELQTKLSITKEQLEQKENQYNTLVSTSGIDESGASALLETNKTLEGITKTLREKLGVAEKELASLKKKYTNNEQELKQANAQVQQLNNTIEVLSSGNASAATTVGAKALMKPINYTGNAKLIPVFGNGSFGTTTTAMSIANKLFITSKVLYLDFDLVVPKADSWFKKMPVCQRVRGINPNDPRMTGLGIFYEKGIQTFVTNFADISQNIQKAKGGSLDYVSGVYYRVDNMKLIMADYTNLFNFLATQYQYIIIDLGRLGSSDINDQLIKLISDISNNNVVVTTSDLFGVRNFRMKLNENEININNVAWLINMCESTNIDEKLKGYIQPANYSIMIKDKELFGNRETFLKDRMSRDKFELFINSVLFAQRR